MSVIFQRKTDKYELRLHDEGLYFVDEQLEPFLLDLQELQRHLPVVSCRSRQPRLLVPAAAVAIVAAILLQI